MATPTNSEVNKVLFWKERIRFQIAGIKLVYVMRMNVGRRNSHPTSTMPRMGLRRLGLARIGLVVPGSA